MNWKLLANEMPKPFHRVLVCCTWESTTTPGKICQYRSVAMYRTHKGDSAEYCEDCEEWAFTDDEGETFWWPEGWWESAQEAETQWLILKPVTHWMELPDKPTLEISK